ncbi:ATP-binding cassette domain-containing protein [Actinoplanes subtropicus]|uniref:ATP-binding cassette domain-containing protein n=1 Tax=Actinoplanes subtropicus TaxID=543632 RepID=UPI001FE17DB8|nr:ABC transporter ATP-binding protein [Actinoplanes subtropicus]
MSKRYRRGVWALREATLAIPEGRVVALVGPNGAGKSTLLTMVVGLAVPTSGELAVLGGLVPGSVEALGRVAFVAQDPSLYPNLSVADTLRLAGNLSSRWDEADARARLAALDIPLRRKVGQLSGGQQAQVALAVALARRPGLLILDEPLASLDPLARHEFMATVMAAVAEEGLSVVFSSHVLAELERACDYLVVLARGAVQVAGDVDELLSEHSVLTGPAEQADAVTAGLCVVREQRTDRQSTVLVRDYDPVRVPAGWRAERTNLEELVLAYLRTPSVSALPGPASGNRTMAAPLRAVDA